MLSQTIFIALAALPLAFAASNSTKGTFELPNGNQLQSQRDNNTFGIYKTENTPAGPVVAEYIACVAYTLAESSKAIAAAASNTTEGEAIADKLAARAIYGTSSSSTFPLSLLFSSTNLLILRLFLVASNAARGLDPHCLVQEELIDPSLPATDGGFL